MFSFKHRVGSTIAAIAAFMLMGAAPAAAESTTSSSQASTTHSFAPLGQGDDTFRQLFSGWEKADATHNGLSAPAAKVAVPSRMPLDNARLSSDFGMRTHPVMGGRRHHRGVDLASPTGTPVYATADGRVDMAQWFSSYGLYIQINHGGDLETRYAHLSSLAVTQGQKVRKGDLIGHVGSTGRSTGPHLHYEVRVAGQAVNPIPYMVETSAQRAFALARGEGGQGGPE